MNTPVPGPTWSNALWTETAPGDEPEGGYGPVDAEDPGDARYLARGTLGRGGMAEVELCMDGRLERTVALKRLRWELSGIHEARLRFEREIRVQAYLDHPAVVPVFDRGIGQDGRAFFTMRRISGRTFAEVLFDLHKMPLFEERQRERLRLLRAFLRACLAVDYAHDNGVIHRDLKPANLMLGSFGELYVLDWGVARLVSEEMDPVHLSANELTGGDEDSDLTQGQRVLGTPAYMAPEQRKAPARVTPRSDVYALGAVLFEILVGRRLREDGADAWPEGDALHPSRQSPEGLPDLDGVVERACALDPEARFPTARALHDAVASVLDGDRDLARRQELAEGHRLQAERHSRRGEVADALREAGRALALDPAHPATARLLSEELLLPGDADPDTLVEERNEADIEDGSRALRFNAGATVAMVALVGVVAPFIGTLRLDLLAIGLVPPVVGAILLAQGRTGSRLMPRVVLRALVMCAAFAAPVAVSAAAFGPYVLPPLVAMAVCVVTVCVVGIQWRRLLMCGMVLGTLVAVQVWYGLFGDTVGTEVSASHMRVEPVLLGFDPSWTPSAILLFNLGLVAVVTLVVWRNVEALLASRQSLHRLEWRLRQMSVGEADPAPPRLRQMSVGEADPAPPQQPS